MAGVKSSGSVGNASSSAVTAQAEGIAIAKGFKSGTTSAGETWARQFEKGTANSGQVWGKAFGNVVATALNRVASEVTKSFDRVQSEYLSKYDEMSAKMNKSAREYRQYYTDLNKQLKEQNIQWAFSMKDVMSAMQTNYSMGMRGEIAAKKSLTDIISKKLVPSLNTSTEAYKAMYRQYGDSFARSQTATAKYIEKMIGSMDAYETGTVESTLSSLYQQLRYSDYQAGRETNTSAQYLTMALSAMGGNSADSSSFVAAIQDIAQHGMGADQGSFAKLNVTEWSQVADMLSSQEGALQLVSNYANYVKKLAGSGETAGIMIGDTMGNSVDAYNVAVIDKVVSDMDKLVSGNLNVDEYYAQQKKLLEGQSAYYTTADEKLSNIEDSLMTNDVTLAMANLIPKGVLSDIGNDVKQIFYAIIANSGINGIKGSKLGGGTGKILSRAGRAAIAETSVKGGWSALSTAGKAIPIAGAVMSLLSMGHDAATGDSILDAFTGKSKFEGKSREEKLELAKNGKWFSLGEVIDNGLKGAGIGGLAGLAGGPLAGLTSTGGAAIGAAVGIVTNVTKQFVDAHKYKKYVEAQEASTEAFSALDEKTNALSATFADTTATEGEKAMAVSEALTALEEAAAAATEELNRVKKLDNAQLVSQDADLNDAAVAYANKLSNGESVDMREFASSMGVNYDELNNIINDEGLIKSNGKVNKRKLKKFVNKYGLSGDVLADMSGTLAEINKQYDALYTLAQNGTTKDNSIQYATDLEHLRSLVTAYNSSVPYGSEKDTSEWHDAIGYRTGLNYVSYDNYPALLHEGEAVLTKQEARGWRALTNGGILAKLVASNAGSIDKDAIESISTKIDSIGGVLDSILQVVVDIYEETKSTIPTTSSTTANRELTTFSGGAL